MLRRVRRRKGDVHVLLGNDIVILFPDTMETLGRELFDRVVGLGLLILVLDFRRVDDGKKLPLFDRIAFVKADPLEITGYFSIESRLVPRRS